MKILYALGGLAMCGVALVVLAIGSNLFADAHSEPLMGPGAAAWVIDRWPAPGSTMRVEVEGHGGSRAGVNSVVARWNGLVLAQAQGKGAHWGSVISGSKSRGNDVVELTIPIPADVPAGTQMDLELDVETVCAMTTNGSFSNDAFRHQLALSVVPVAAGGELSARLVHLSRALLALALWFAVLLAGVRVLGDPTLPREDSESAGVAAIGLIICGGIVGYWGFARVVSAVLGSPTGLDVVLTIAWLTVAPWGAWRLLRRRTQSAVSVRTGEF